MGKLVITLTIALALALTGCAVDGLNGADGAPGADGRDGAPGVDGRDGRDGTDGRDGRDALVEVITPCDETRPFAEVLLRLNDGVLYAVYADQGSGKIHLTAITPGLYMTTDGYNCIFEVLDNGEVTW